MTDDAERTGLGRRRTAASPDPSVRAGVDAPAGADSTSLGARRGTTTPPPADATGLGAPTGTTTPPAEATGLGTRTGTTTPPPAADATGLGARPAAAPATDSRSPQVNGGRPDGDNVRFGPGVLPASRPSTPTWQQTADRPERASRPPERGPSKRSRRLSSLLGFLTVVVVAATVALLLYQPSTPVLVTAVGVAPNPAEAGCGTTVDVVGTLTTDGAPGVVRYQWLRSDGVGTDVLSQSVGTGQTSTEVHLQWTVSGQGSFEGTATLRVVGQQPVESSGSFTYSCS